MSRMVRITPPNASEFYSRIPARSNRRQRIVGFLLTFGRVRHKNEM